MRKGFRKGYLMANNSQILFTSTRKIQNLNRALSKLKYISAKFNGRGQMLRNMMKPENQYVFVIYYEGKYPASKRRKSSIPVSVIAKQLQTGFTRGAFVYNTIRGVKIRVGRQSPNKIRDGSVGRPRTKKWPFEKWVEYESRTWLARRVGIAQRKYLRGTIKSLYDAMKVISRSYQVMLKKKIIETEAPPLEDSTIRARKSRGIDSEKPLVETGRLASSVRVKVMRVATFKRSIDMEKMKIAGGTKRAYTERYGDSMMVPYNQYLGGNLWD